MTHYTLTAVTNYLDSLPLDVMLYTLPGVLLDTYIIDHGAAIEILQERYMTSNSSAYIRHVYRKRIPAHYFKTIREYENLRRINPDYAAEILNLFETFNNSNK